MALGTLVTYVVGAYLPWHFLSYFCIGFPVVLFLTVLLLPETPTWLMTKGSEDKAQKALQWLRGGRNIRQDI